MRGARGALFPIKLRSLVIRITTKRGVIWRTLIYPVRSLGETQLVASESVWLSVVQYAIKGMNPNFYIEISLRLILVRA
jgi:hypothetical protein